MLRVVGQQGRAYVATQDAPLPAHDPGLIRASAFAGCAKRAACQRLGVPPVLSLRSETGEGKQVLFMLGTATERFWVDVLTCYLGAERVQTQRAALDSGGVLGKLPLPELEQCVTSVRDGQAVVPICPWFCPDLPVS